MNVTKRAFFSIIFALVATSLFIIFKNYKLTSCLKIGKTQIIIIQDGKFLPNAVTVKLCDRVEFLNKDTNTLYLPAFGDHPNHTTYPGFNEKAIGFNQSNSFVAKISGKFKIHDHLKDKAEGEIIISKE